MEAEPVGDPPVTLSARLGEVAEWIQQLDLRGRIAADPWPAVGAAALFGVWLGFAPRGPRPTKRPDTRSRLGDAVLATLGSVALRLAREAAFREMGALARRWWDETSEPARVPAGSYPP